MNPLLPCVALSVVGLAQSPLRTPEAVAAAERAFAEMAGQVGTPAAFLANLTEDALVFMPRPLNGHAVYRAQPEDGSRLSWAPEHVEVAASGDFALSTGPWQWRAKAGAEAGAQGHFLSLWVLREGRWRVLLDVGVPHPAQGAATLDATTLKAPESPGARETLGAVWRAFDGAAGQDVAQALKLHAAADVRVYRRGHPVKAGAWPPLPAGGAEWTESGRHVAPSLDLAVRWGRRGPHATVVQCWRREGGTWRLAMDVELPSSDSKPDRKP